MEAKLKRESISYYTLVYTGAQSREETAESVIPDTMPDAARILDADAAVFLRAKGVQDGRYCVRGGIQGTVLYLAEEGDGPLRLDIAMETEFFFDGEEPVDEDSLTVSLHINAADARLLNPRKLLLRCEVSAAVSAYRGDALELATEPETAPPLQTLQRQRTVSIVAALEEKTFVVAEELTLPAGRPLLSSILSWRCGAAVDDTRQVGGKLILQGAARLELLYAPEDNAPPQREEFSVSFSQILDVGEGRTASPGLVLMPTACFVEPLSAENGVSMELHLTAQAVCRCERELRYIADAYSTKHACTVETEEKQVVCDCRCLTLRETARELLDTPETAQEALSCHVVTGSPTLCDGAVSVPLCVHALYLTDKGCVSSVTKKLNVSLPWEAPASASYSFGEAQCPSPYLSPAAGGLELRLPVELRLEVCETETITCVRAVSVDTERPALHTDSPSLTVVRCPDGAVWPLAKRYCSTPELIEAANPGVTAPGSLLLIPRAR